MYVHLSGNIVDFVMEANPSGVFGSPYVDEFIYTDQEGVTNGWLLQDGVFVAPPLPPSAIPSSITPRQARLKLLEANLLDNLEAVITTNRAWQIEWEYATEVKRDSPLIDAVASEAGLTEEQIDQMFIEASKL
jgi:hypothetical protein